MLTTGGLLVQWTTVTLTEALALTLTV